MNDIEKLKSKERTMNGYKRTTNWKEENGMKSMNFCIPFALWLELQNMKNTTGSTISEMIRTGIRMYINDKKRQLVDLELKALQAEHLNRKNQSGRINTGLLPDY